jgi:DNA-binding LacI/PurR family transcriptional regulator
MADIARMAGCPRHVSRALSGSPLIQQDTANALPTWPLTEHRVNASAAACGAKHFHGGCGHARQRGTPHTSPSGPFIMSMVACLADALAERGQDMLLARYGHNRMDQLPDLVETGRVAGLIVMGQWSWHDQLNAMARRGVPMAVWGAAVPGTLYAVVGSDNETGGYLATRHLIDQGCQRIACLGDLQHQAALPPGCPARSRPHAARHRKNPFVCRAQPGIVDEWWPKRHARRRVRVSDLAAMGLVRAYRHGQACPPMCAWWADDIALAEHFHPSLTTVRQSIATGAYLGADAGRPVARHAPQPAGVAAGLIVRSSLPPRADLPSGWIAAPGAKWPGRWRSSTACKHFAYFGFPSGVFCIVIKRQRKRGVLSENNVLPSKSP